MTGPRFTQVLLREGYLIAEVDAFLDGVERRFGRTPDAELAAEIRDVRFTPVRLRPGYDMGEVDQYLDELTRRAETGR